MGTKMTTGTGKLEKDMLIVARQMIEWSCYGMLLYWIFNL
jgi:hypothetical protein